MLKLADADARILVKRIAKAIRKARYYPAEIKDEEAAAFEVLLPYVSREFKSSRRGRQAEH